MSFVSDYVLTYAPTSPQLKKETLLVSAVRDNIINPYDWLLFNGYVIQIVSETHASTSTDRTVCLTLPVPSSVAETSFTHVLHKYAQGEYNTAQRCHIQSFLKKCIREALARSKERGDLRIYESAWSYLKKRVYNKIPITYGDILKANCQASFDSACA
jgi:GR25 family glycosyltransferase involved in LPS biosynthesis